MDGLNGIATLREAVLYFADYENCKRGKDRDDAMEPAPMDEPF